MVILNLFQNHAYAQDRTIDSLKLALKSAKHDTIRCKLLNILAETAPEGEWENFNEQLGTLAEKNCKAAGSFKNKYLKYWGVSLANQGVIYFNHGNLNKALEFYSKGLKIQEEQKDMSGIASSFNNIAAVYSDQGNLPKAIEFYEKSLKLHEELGEKRGVAIARSNVGSVYCLMGDFLRALEYFHKSLKIQEEIGDMEGLSSTLNSLGFVYDRQGDLEKALQYFNKSLVLREKVGRKTDIANVLCNIGTIYNDRRNYTEALKYYNRSLKIQQEVDDKNGMAITYLNVAAIYQIQKDMSKALEYYFKVLEISEEIGDKDGVGRAQVEIASIYCKQKKHGKALEFALNGMRISWEVGYPESIRRSARVLNDIYKGTGNYKLALENYELEIKMFDSINNETKKKSTIKKQFQIEYEREAIKDSVANLAKTKESQLKHETAITQQRTYTYGGFAGLALMLVVAGVSFKAFKNKQKANIIITEQKQIAEAQKHIIEEKQKEIIDSINYARRIQRAHLPNEKYISRKIGELKKKN